jgi:hypothetical protein
VKDRFILISDMVEANGKTVRENNLEKGHTIPLGSLVECNSESGDYEWEGIRLYVVKHSRDCDGGPLYDLGEKEGKVLLCGFDSGCMEIIK